MRSVVELSSSGEPVSFVHAKQYLRQLSPGVDDEILDMLPEARAWAERICERTLRTTVQRRWDQPTWPSGPVWLRRPPLITVDSVQYYDESETLQTVASTLYHVFTPTDGKGYLCWDEDFTFPDTHDRPDAVQITYTSGSSSHPPEVRRGILLLLQVLWGEDDAMRPGFGDKTLQRAKEILGSISTNTYV